MAAMVDLLLRRAPAASGEVYDVLRGCPAMTSAEPAGAFHDWADPDPHPFNLLRP